MLPRHSCELQGVLSGAGRRGSVTVSAGLWSPTRKRGVHARGLDPAETLACAAGSISAESVTDPGTEAQRRFVFWAPAHYFAQLGSTGTPDPLIQRWNTPKSSPSASRS